ncbi:hypothetical protein BD324DRAFT_254113 [Kockovaella imperatae]|uniref:DNA-directed RNA polymerase subunit n=1 Tax=Kockovaella imperatae TaxID=4999 RepID=A0A1Y1UPS5_9TREE|nr:hypothetical protein BD324DRAFT_254113 [Kockovaella imperatae]ORX40060.1 hypothetical protein BD324DRAFT_254113 [Kockovaella imperatae]
MDIAHPVSTEVTSLAFSFLTAEEIRSISVTKIDNPILLDNFNLPTKGGLYDPKLGPMSAKDVCETCHLSYFACPGHFGHIDLPVPLYHPLFMTTVYRLLQSTCLYCHHFKMPEMMVQQYIARIQLLNAGLFKESHDVAHLMPKTQQADEDEEGGGGGGATMVPVETAAEHIVKLDDFVRYALHQAKKHGAEKDNYRDGVVYEERRALLEEVLKGDSSRSWRTKCSRCRAVNPTYRKERTVKIIELELDNKQKLTNTHLGVKRREVLSDGRGLFKKDKSNRAQNGDDESSSESGSEAKEDDEMEENFDEEEEEEEEEDDEDILNRVTVAKTASGKVKGAKGRNERVMSPGEVRAHLRVLFQKESKLCHLLYGRHGGTLRSRGNLSPTALADMFFVDVLSVTPTRFRPPAKMGDDLFENPQNSLLSAVITTCKRIQDLNHRLIEHAKAERGDEVLEVIDKVEGGRLFELLLESLIKLQHDVNSFMDSTKNPTVMAQGKLPHQGIKQLLEKKEGLFRKHMMGKRVNYAARSVISPDINIETNEIGIPPVFARKLTYPEPVTAQNVAELRQLVINGPRQHPGASMVQMEDGTRVSLDRTTLEQRTAIANQLATPQSEAHASSSLGPAARNKKVFRHIRDGDIVILNRQPTLHKPSMMCHKVKVLLGEKTIRMHYANCNSYNADFDGDEMNIHFPQNEVARAEALMIANTDNQYLVPTSGKPLRGLIQDHVVAAVHMCSKSSFFTREQYFQLIYGALRTEDDYTGGGRILTVAPAIWKPRPMWTGKQIVSTILLNLTPPNARGLNLTSRNKIDHALWGREKNVDPNMSEEKTIFVDGHLVCGVLDKSQFGASDFGLVHSVHELYGPMIANRLLGILSRLFTKYLQHDAFSCRMDDLTLTAEGEKLRQDILDKASDLGTKTSIKYVGLPEDSQLDKETQHNLDVRLEETLRDDNLMAGLDAVMQSAFNKTTSQINNDVLPKYLVRPFPDNNMQMMTISGAKGSKVNASQISTLLGQQALEGRRVPTMVSGKTLPSFRAFDTSARAGGYVANRFLTGIRPQEYYFHCMAGREGLIDTAVKTSRSGYLQRCLIKHLEGVKVHYDHTVRDSDLSVLQFLYGEDALDVTRSRHLQSFDFAAQNHDSLINRYKPGAVLGKVVTDEAVDHMKKALKKPEKYEPALSKFSPSRYLGSMSETFAKQVRDYTHENKAGLISRKGQSSNSSVISEKEFVSLARSRYMRGLVDPGEAVGLLASQGVGEPSTQMTLNTFHLAGHGAANVTLGIPRLREIVMTASTHPMTPTMKLPIRETIGDGDVEAFVKQVSRLTLSQVVDKVTVTERLSGRSDTDARLRKYTVLLEFYPKEEYSEEYEISALQIHEALAFNFSVKLKKEILNEMRITSKALSQDMAVGVGMRVREGEDEGLGARRGRDDELDDDDMDAYQAKRTAQARQHEYEEDDRNEQVEDLEDYVERQFEDDDEEDVDAGEKAETDARGDALLEAFKKGSKYATDLHFDSHKGKSAQFELEFPANTPKLLLVDIVERACRSAVIHEVPDIGRCMKVFDDKGEFTRSLITEGSNLTGMHALADELVDLDRIGSNDIAALLQTYGVEAARRAIIDEVSAVFGAYGIAVDYRHLTVIADYMTHAGGYRPFNRSGISKKSSPLLKASFETTVQFLSEAVLHGDFDDLTSPAAKIVMGQPSTSGTGSFDIRAPRRMVLA